MTTKRKKRRSPESNVADLRELLKAANKVLDFFPGDTLEAFVDEAQGRVKEEQRAAKRSKKDLGWNEADSDLFMRESRLLKQRLKPINGTPLLGSNADGEIVVQGMLRINNTRSEPIIMVYPRNFPERPPQVYRQFDDSMAPIDLGDPPAGWTVHETGLFILDKVKVKLARNCKAKK